MVSGDLFAKDIKETQSLLLNIPLLLRLIKRSLYQPFFHPILKFWLKKRIGSDQNLKLIDVFLLDQGGMYKKHVVYRITGSFRPIKNSSILFPGVCKGDNILQLASFGPEKIVAYDPYKFYPERLEALKSECRNRFGVEFIFYKNLEDLPSEYLSSFDFVISEATLEHVSDLKQFLSETGRYLRPGGVFYAGYGPLWYGMGGDHAWYPPYDDEAISQVTKDYIHLFRPKSVYENGMFSKLTVQQYFEGFQQTGFQKRLAYAAISLEALKLLGKDKKLDDALTRQGVPGFDRYCLGMYVWMQKQSET